jgi:signal peptidase I
MTSTKSTFRLIAEPIVLAVALAAVVRSAVQIYSIPSASMTPTLLVGDHILVTPYGVDDHPQRGDIVVFRSPGHEEELMVKRVIAMPGDLIESRGSQIAIGGHTLAEPYTEPYAGQTAPSLPVPTQIVPAGCYFVMGDNRGNSRDSRHWGSLPQQLVVGRARMVLWSSGNGASESTASAETTRQTLPRHARPSLGRLFLAVR